MLYAINRSSLGEVCTINELDGWLMDEIIMWEDEEENYGKILTKID